MQIYYVVDAPHRWRRWAVFLPPDHPWNKWPGSLIVLKSVARQMLYDYGLRKNEADMVLLIAERYPVRLADLSRLQEEFVCPA